MATLEQLKKVAEEFNEVMDGLNPLIDTSLSEKKLTKVLKQAITFIDPVEDHFSDETQAVIDELSSIENLVKENTSLKQQVAEKIHKQNIADKPVRNDDEDENDDTPDDPELLTPSGRKQVPIPAKKELFAKKASTSADRVAFITPFIEKGKSTKAQLVEKLTAKFPDLAISSLATLLTDAKNPRYNRFAKLVVQDKDGIMSFVKE